MFMILHGKQIVIIKSPSGETTLARILPVPLSLGRNQRHVLVHYDVDVQKLSGIYILNVFSLLDFGKWIFKLHACQCCCYVHANVNQKIFRIIPLAYSYWLLGIAFYIEFPQIG